MNVSLNVTRRENFDAAFAFDSSEHSSVNFDLRNSDVRMDQGVLADNENISGRDGSVKVTVDAQRSGKLQLTGHVGALIEEA